jgi:hypothetical protein
VNKKPPKKFTFKNTPRATGRASVGAGTPDIVIKYAGVKVGFINFNNSWSSNTDLGIRIHLMFPKEITEDDKCPWKWVIVKQKFESADEAENYVNENFEKISSLIYVQKED